MTEIKLALADPRVQLRALQLAVERLASTPLQGAAQILTHLREAIEEQVKPAVEEPEEFGSLVRARSFGPLAMLWQRSPENGKHYWESDTGAVEVWSGLQDVEVLRVGIGESVFDRGAEAATTTHLSVLRTLRSEAITSERKDAYDTAISRLEGLRP